MCIVITRIHLKRTAHSGGLGFQINRKIQSVRSRIVGCPVDHDRRGGVLISAGANDNIYKGCCNRGVLRGLSRCADTIPAQIFNRDIFTGTNNDFAQRSEFAVGVHLNSTAFSIYIDVFHRDKADARKSDDLVVFVDDSVVRENISFDGEIAAGNSTDLGDISAFSHHGSDFHIAAVGCQQADSPRIADLVIRSYIGYQIAGCNTTTTAD